MNIKNIIISCALGAFVSTSQGAISFAEVTPDTVLSQTATGTLDGVNWTATITGAPLAEARFQHPGSFGQFSGFADNSVDLWNNAAYNDGTGATPGNGLDLIAVGVFRDLAPTVATMEIVFNEEVRDLVLHFANLDSSSVTVAAVDGLATGFGVARLSGASDDFDVTGNVISDIDADVNFGTFLPVPDPALSGYGSVAIDIPSLTTLTLDLESIRMNTEDGYGLIFSGRVIPEPSSTLLMAIAGMSFIFRRRRA